MFVEEKKTGEVALEPWRDILLRAADYMEEHGHCKHQFTNEQGRVCMLGAVRVFDPLYTSIVWRKWWEPLEHVCGGFISAWNDRPETTKEMAVAKLREAAYL